MAHNESFSEFSAVIGLPDLNWGCPTWDFASFQDVVETWCGSRGRWANVHESGSVPTAGRAWWTTMPDGAKVTRVSCLFFYFSHCLRSMVDRLIGGESYAWRPPLMDICIPFVLTCAVDSKLFCGETFSESRFNKSMYIVYVCTVYYLNGHCERIYFPIGAQSRDFMWSIEWTMGLTCQPWKFIV